MLFFARPLRAQSPILEASPIKGSMFTPSLEWVWQTKPGELLTTVRLQQTYDSNVTSSPTQHLGGTYTNPEGVFRYAQERPSRQWMLTYQVGGRIYNPRFSSLDSPSNDVRFQAQQKLNPRLNVSIYERWASVSTSGFETPSPGQAFPVQSPPDENLAFLLRRQRTSESDVIFQYQVALHTSLVWGGNYEDLKYSATIATRSQTTGAYVSFYQQLTKKQTMGVGYLSQWISFPGQPVRSRVDNFLGSYSNQLAPGLAVSVFGGPAFVYESSGSAMILNNLGRTQRNVVGGVTLDKKLGRNTLLLRYDRMYSRGSVPLGTTFRQSSSVTIGRQVSPRLSVSLSGNYSRNNLAEFAVHYTSYRVQPGLRFRLGRPRMWLTFQQAYSRALGQSAIAGLSRNLVEVGFEYDLPDISVER